MGEVQGEESQIVDSSIERPASPDGAVYFVCGVLDDDLLAARESVATTHADCPAITGITPGVLRWACSTNTQDHWHPP